MTNEQLGVLLLNITRQLNLSLTTLELQLAENTPPEAVETLKELWGLSNTLEAQAAHLGVAFR